MLNKIFLGVGIVIVIFAVYVGYILAKTKIESPLESVETSVGRLNVKVDYSRPFKKGRKIFGGLVPYNKYWRTGANEATQIHFSRDAVFGGEMVRAGTYWLYSIPSEDKWVVALNRELGAWGIPGPNTNLDVLRTEVKVENLREETEQFKITLNNGESHLELKMAWDLTEVKIPIKAQ